MRFLPGSKERGEGEWDKGDQEDGPDPHPAERTFHRSLPLRPWSMLQYVLTPLTGNSTE
jgi:hypothetical protein